MPVTVLSPNPDRGVPYHLNPTEIWAGLRCKKCGLLMERAAIAPTRKNPSHGAGHNPTRRGAAGPSSP